MSAAVVEKNGTLRPLDLRATPSERVSQEQVTDPDRLARLLQAHSQELAELRRPFAPRRVDHWDLVVDATGTTKFRLPHSLSARVNWWVIDWSGATAGPQLIRDASSDANTLVLVSKIAGTVSIRIEEAG